MTAHTLTINARRFFLSDETDVTELEQRIEEAARRGGSIITVPGTATSTTALVTPATTVFFDTVAPGTDIHPEDGDQNADYDFDLDSAYDDWLAE